MEQTERVSGVGENNRLDYATGTLGGSGRTLITRISLMPLKRGVQVREPELHREQEEPEAGAEQPILEEPATARDVEQGRPHQAFIENRLRQYLQDENIRSLVKPTQDEIRAAAMQILGQALRKRPGQKLNPYLNMAHRAVVDVVEHAREQRWTRQPLSAPYAGANYVEALIQLADDADWLAREIHIPEHPSIYYTRNARTGKPVPKETDYIRGKYLSEVFGPRLLKNSRIYPYTSSKRGSIYYSLYDKSGAPSVRIHYHVVGGGDDDWRDYFGTHYYIKELEVMRTANNEIAAINRSDLGWKEQVTRLYEIRKPLGLL